MTVLPHFLGGQFVGEASSQPTFVKNPTRPDDLIGALPSVDAALVQGAVDAAQAAQPAWAALTGPGRAEVLFRWAEVISSRLEELAQAVAREVGKPIGEARGEVGRCVAILRYYAGDAVRETGDVIPAQVGGALQYSTRRPLGVVGLITPWNFPLAIPLWKAAPALAVGNAVVMKASEFSSHTAVLLAETAEAAKVPAGIFNVILGAGATAGQALLEAKGISAISFTGSARTGAHVAETCAKRNVKFQTEMGGKNVAIVLPDADLTQAANLIAGGAFRYAGQKCTATSRVIVDKSISEAFLVELKKATDALPIGDPADVKTAVGPVINEAAHERLQAVLAGADVELLHQIPTGQESGYFIAPSIYKVATTQHPFAQTEFFGPVLSYLEAEGLDQALEMANDTEFGLSASLFTKNITAALKYIDRIEVGLVRVNADTTGVDPHSPFGGVKGSSSHSREQGPTAKEFYTEYRTVQINP